MAEIIVVTWDGGGNVPPALAIAHELATLGDRGMGRDLLVELSRRRADLVIVDTLMLGVLDVVRRAGVRYAVLEHFYDGYLQGALRGPLGLVLRARGLRPGRSLRDATLRVVTSLPELAPLMPSPTVHQVGPVVTWLPRVDTEAGVLV